MKEQTSILHYIPVDPLTGAVSTPIYQTSTFVQEAPGIHKGFDYARTSNPTRKILEDLMTKIEHGANAFAFASGLAAIDAILKLLDYGDEIIAVDDIYGGAFRLFTQVYKKFGIHVKYVDTSDASNVALAITSKTKLIWLESPTNPCLKISDIAVIAEIARTNQLLLCVDNTFASPVLQKPILLGADIVIHSATKYLGGHSDLIAGIVICKSETLSEKIKFIQNASGAILSPFDSWLVIRGIETLHVRIRQHNESAEKIARYLLTEELVRRVYYPGLKSHKNHLIACKQQSGFGGMISFDLKIDDRQLAIEFVSATSYFKLAESLGGVKSLICLPAEMTHKTIPKDIRYQSGVTDSLIRLSVGLEDADDLIEDLRTVFNKLRNKKILFQPLQEISSCTN
jgi:cystathionine beta-lyase